MNAIDGFPFYISDASTLIGIRVEMSLPVRNDLLSGTAADIKDVELPILHQLPALLNFQLHGASPFGHSRSVHVHERLMWEQSHSTCCKLIDWANALNVVHTMSKNQ